MRRIFLFYADVFVLQNLCMDYIALTGVNYFLKRRQRLRRLLMISIFASLGSLFLHIYIINIGIRTIILHFFLNTVMTGLAFGWNGKREFLENWFFIYLTILFLGGIMEWETGLGIPAAFFWIKAAIGALLLTLATRVFMQKKEVLDQIFQVEVIHHGKTWKLKGYWDSGNLLVDPYIGKPVNILKGGLAEQIFSEKEDYMRLIPYCSLGNENGLLSVYNAERMYIFQGKKRLEVAPAVFGIAGAGLLEGKEYDVILQTSMLERER